MSTLALGTTIPTSSQAAALNTPVVVTINYSPIDHNFNLTIKGATEVSYLLKYLSKVGPETTEQAISHGGKADANKLFTATHLAGTESGGAQVFHQVTSGGLEVTAKNATKQDIKIYKTFTVSDKGVIKVTDVTAETMAGMVQGASTDSAMLDQPVTPLMATPLALPVRKNVPSSMTDTSVAAVTPTQSGINFQKVGPMVAGLGVLLLLVLLGLAWKRRSSAQPASNSTEIPPQPPTQPLEM